MWIWSRVARLEQQLAQVEARIVGRPAGPARPTVTARLVDGDQVVMEAEVPAHPQPNQIRFEAGSYRKAQCVDGAWIYRRLHG